MTSRWLTKAMTTSGATEHTTTVTPDNGGATVTVRCTCGWVAFNGAQLSPAGAERAASIHTR